MFNEKKLFHFLLTAIVGHIFYSSQTIPVKVREMTLLNPINFRLYDPCSILSRKCLYCLVVFFANVFRLQIQSIQKIEFLTKQAVVYLCIVIQCTEKNVSYILNFVVVVFPTDGDSNENIADIWSL